MNTEPTPEPAENTFDLEEHELRLLAVKGQIAVRRAFEQMMERVDAGEADRGETIAAMSSVMKMINGYGRDS